MNSRKLLGSTGNELRNIFEKFLRVRDQGSRVKGQGLGLGSRVRVRVNPCADQGTETAGIFFPQRPETAGHVLSAAAIFLPRCHRILYPNRYFERSIFSTAERISSSLARMCSTDNFKSDHSKTRVIRSFLPLREGSIIGQKVD